MSCVLLGVVSAGLLICYVILIYTLRVYFKEQMKVEQRRVSILYASFILSYNLRFAFQLSHHRNFWVNKIP